MKKYITAALLFCAALTAACSKETAGSADTGDTGALEMRVSATRAEADGEYDPLQRLAVRIYRASGELLRQYTAETLPSRLELLAGECLGRVRHPAGGNQVRPNLHEPLDLFDRKTAKVRPEFGHFTRFEDRPAIPETLFLYANADHGRPPPTVLTESHDPPPPPPHGAG